MTVLSTACDPVEGLYRCHHHGLLAWLHRKLGNASQAADLAHETFVRVLTRGPAAHASLAELREPGAYLRTIAKGLIVDWSRRQVLEQAYLDALAIRREVYAPSPEEKALILEALELIGRLIDTFKPNMRTAFLLSQIEGVSYADIAAQLGVTVRTIERYIAEGLFRCHCMLRDGVVAGQARP
ncbi:sigma-70 family RNA polymerase sigma factor [Comamonadaceae bacterium PP-2]